jgi:hypothetical protein
MLGSASALHHIGLDFLELNYAKLNYWGNPVINAFTGKLSF